MLYRARSHGGPSSTLDLPTDHARARVLSHHRGQHSFTLTLDLTTALADFVAAEGATPMMGLLAAYAGLLFRYTNGDSFAVGTSIVAPADDIPTVPASQAVHLLGLSIDLADDLSFRSLLQHIRATVLDTYAQEAIPLDQLPASPSAPDAPGGPPFFQILFAYEHGQPAEARPPEAQLQLPGWGPESWADLALAFQQRGPELVACLAYAAELFEPATAERLAGHFVALVEAALATPDLPISALPLLSTAEQAQLAAWNQTDTPLALACIHQLFAAQAALAPAAPALIFDTGRLSYAELDAQTNQLAHHLRELGVGPERIVAVCMGRGKNLIIALLGILKAGGAYLPLDPVYPSAHLSYMLADARPVVLLSDGDLPEGLLAARQEGDEPLHIVDLTRDAAQIAVQPTSAPDDPATLDTLAYVIYTSGSTGRPKGVLLQHRSAANYLLGSGIIYAATRADRGLHFASVSFDASVDEIFLPLVHGAALVVTDDYGPPDFTALKALIARHEITMISLPTAYWHSWITELSYARASLPPSLRLVIIGGEAASGERYNVWRTLVSPSVRLLNGYGPTETTVGSTWYVPSPGQDEPPGPMAIGRPLPNERAYILDQQQRPVAIGVVGELYIGGSGLARGYYNRPELTAERFVTVAGLEGEEPVRLYRTGDLARWRSDGVLLYHGRADQQVKVRGYRIEPGEIEATLRKHPAVQAAAVVTRPDPAGELSLVGYVVLATPDIEPTALRAFLAERLPHYMVPAVLMVLEALPLTPSGKIDRRALPAPTLADPELAQDEEVPHNRVEEVLKRLWQELLGRRVIGLHDDFFELGGHSLLAMRMLVRVEGELGVKLPVSIMIHHSTIADLAQAILKNEESAWSVVVPIRASGARPPLYCIHGFLGDALFFSDLGQSLGPDQPFYGIQSRSLDDSQPHFTSMEDMAAWYVAAIRNVQPQGPYYLCGASYGGIIAFEMAQQLRAQDEEVALLAVLDYDPYAAQEGLGARLRGLANRIRYLPAWVANDFLPLSPVERRGRLARNARVLLKRGISLLLGGKKLPVDAADLMHYGSELPLRRREMLIAHDHAESHYVPRPYDGRVTLISTESRQTVPDNSAEETGWARFARRGVATFTVPGSHDSMFKPPHVDNLARLLNRLIDEAQQCAAEQREANGEIARVG